MKIFKLTLLAFCIMICAGCTVDDEGTPALHGEWKLVHVMGGIAGVDDTFPEGTITWKFNTSSQTVTVDNTNTDESMQDFMPSGVYDYNFAVNTATPEACSDVIVIDGVSFGCMSVDSDELVFSQIESDGFILNLIR